MALRLEEEQPLQQLKLAEHSCASEEGGEQQEERR